MSRILKKLDNELEDIANWHYEMSKDMYRMSVNAQNRNWREACYDRSVDHMKVAVYLRRLIQERGSPRLGAIDDDWVPPALLEASQERSSPNP